MVCTFHYANSHIEMQLNNIIIVSVVVLDVYTITDTNPKPPKMADTNINISGIGASLYIFGRSEKAQKACKNFSLVSVRQGAKIPS